jgi:hypothetical protein
VLVALFLVNLPFVHQRLTDREVARSGREVEATLLDSRTVNGRHLVVYRLPRSVDPARTRYSARVDEPTFGRAQESGVLAVRVVPGKPAANQPAGEVTSPLFTVVALGADAVLLLVAVLLWRRWRRFSRHEVVAVGEEEVTLASRGRTLVAATPPGWAARVRPGQRVSGSLHLVAEGDLLPGPPPSGLEQVEGTTYLVTGRIAEARSRRAVLVLDDGFRLRVDTGEHRVRADIREATEVRGTLCFTPTVARADGP